MTKVVKIGNLYIGGGNRIAVQSMTNVSARDLDATISQCLRLQNCGCDIVRVAVTDVACCENFPKIKSAISMPLVADIHFDWRLAVSAIENGADKIRINPGNFPQDKLDSVIDCAKAHNVPVRIGVNGGSVLQSALKTSKNKVDALFSSLSDYVDKFEKKGFYDIVLSSKSSSVMDTIQLARKLHDNFDYPLHVGVTEAGPFEQGVVFNSVGIGSLLVDGIGDTIRVSLTDEPEKEVETAKTILRAVGKADGVHFVSCPKCGRCSCDLQGMAQSVYAFCVEHDITFKVAVMGCEVNGPGECADADLGMACGKGRVAFFKKGQVYRIVEAENALCEFIKELESFNAD